MIEVQNITKSFQDTVALRDVSFKVEPGRILGFLGANGAGKTTTMDILCGAMGADHGTVTIDGIDIFAEPLKAKQRLGYLPDEPPLHSDMAVQDYLPYVAQLKGLKGVRRRSRIEEILHRLDLASVRHRLIGNLSKGFKQRVGLAQAMIHEPSVLILDEPTEGLDPNQILEIRELVKSFKGGHTIVISSHILSEVESTCDDIAIIDHGKILVQGTTQELRSQASGGTRYRLTVSQNHTELIAALRSQNLATHIDTAPLTNPNGKANKNCFQLDLTLPPTGPAEIKDLILSETLRLNCQIQEFHSLTTSLEDVFLKLTHDPHRQPSTN